MKEANDDMQAGFWCPKIQPLWPHVLIQFVPPLGSGIVLVGLSKDLLSIRLAIPGSRPLSSRLVTLI